MHTDREVLHLVLFVLYQVWFSRPFWFVNQTMQCNHSSAAAEQVSELGEGGEAISNSRVKYSSAASIL